MSDDLARHGLMQDYALTLDKVLDHAARWHPRQVVATADDGGVTHTTYADLRDRAGRVSAVLAELGIGVGDRVATLAWNSAAHVEAWYGTMGMGAVCHTLNPRLTAEQLAAMLTQSAARVLVVSADLRTLVSKIVALPTAVRDVLVIDGPAWDIPGVRALEPLLVGAGEAPAWGDFPETAPCGLCFTSGTTGAPKGVTYTHRAIYLHTLRTLSADVMGLRQTDSVLAVVPMFHANGWGLPFATAACGARLVLPGRHADGASLAKLIASEGVTVAVGVPTVWLGLADHCEASGIALPSLQRVLVGGAPMAPALMERIERVLGVTVQTSWGMTELSPLGTIARPGDPGRVAATAGRPALGLDLMLADAQGNPIPDQRDGEGRLFVRGPAVVERYFDHELSATDANGWFDTGDLARIDDHGNLYITGRAKDLIKSGGEWINPGEIEALVGQLPEVSLAAVIGRAHDKWGERPILLVELRGDASDDYLLGPLRGEVASWWIPDAVVRLDRMPLAATGKIDKLRLRSQYGTA